MLPTILHTLYLCVHVPHYMLQTPRIIFPCMFPTYSTYHIPCWRKLWSSTIYHFTHYISTIYTVYSTLHTLHIFPCMLPSLDVACWCKPLLPNIMLLQLVTWLACSLHFFLRITHYILPHHFISGNVPPHSTEHDPHIVFSSHYVYSTITSLLHVTQSCILSITMHTPHIITLCVIIPSMQI